MWEGHREEQLFDSFPSQFGNGGLTLECCPRIAFMDDFPIYLWYSLRSYGICKYNVGSQVLSLSG
jgi:hypothetical protein